MTRSTTNESTWTAPRCADCEVGKQYDSATGMICFPCLPGQYAASTASASCDACPPGKLNAAVGSGSCEDCPTGGFCGSGTVNSEQCPAGTYNPTVGATNSSFCLKCPAGKASSVRPPCTTRRLLLPVTTCHSPLIIHPSPLTPHPSSLTPHPSPVTRCLEVPMPPRVSTAPQGPMLAVKAV